MSPRQRVRFEDLDVGRRVKVWLAVHGIKQSELAESLGVSRQYLSGVINGGRKASSRIAQELSSRIAASPEEWEDYYEEQGEEAS